MKKWIVIIVVLFTQHIFAAGDITVKMYTTENHTPIGTVLIQPTAFGVLFFPSLSSLTPGLHGFHLHNYPSCDDKGQAAGGHYDPLKTNSHQGPYGNGHLGDLPALFVNKAGEATHPVLAPKLTLSDLKNRSLMIHQGGDNYSDKPLPMGGGGARVACGVIRVLK